MKWTVVSSGRGSQSCDQHDGRDRFLVIMCLLRMYVRTYIPCSTNILYSYIIIIYLSVYFMLFKLCPDMSWSWTPSLHYTNNWDMYWPNGLVLIAKGSATCGTHTYVCIALDDRWMWGCGGRGLFSTKNLSSLSSKEGGELLFSLASVPYEWDGLWFNDCMEKAPCSEGRWREDIE